MAKPADDLQHDPLLQQAPSCEGFKVLDPAVLYARVGAGGMGAVYRGRHFSLECDVAVKVLKPELAHDAQFVARFAREAKLAARIANDNVVRVLDVKSKNGIHYLVMEFVHGETARERVKRKGPLAESEALAILLGAATGLRDAHAQGIVHRDIKPDNVLVSADGAIKLADLGLAKQKQTADEQNLTVLASGVMGTPQYMPPEQWRSPDVTPAADVWALGATLYYLLAGKSGIPGGEMLVVAEHIRDHDFPDVRVVRPDVRPEVAALLTKCTSRRPADRFADARELVKALRPLCSVDDELLRDPAAGADNSHVALVTPPPRATLARIKLQVEQDPDEVATRAGPPPTALTQPGAPVPPAAPGAAPEPRSTVVAPARRARAGTWVVAALLLLAAAAGAGYADGWFLSQPRGAGRDVAAVPVDEPAPPPATATPRADNKLLTDGATAPAVLPDAGAAASGAPAVPAADGSATIAPLPTGAATTPDAAGAATEAQAALARGLAALPRTDGLDDAIRELERARRLDATLTAASANLVLALVRRSAQRLDGDAGAALADARAATAIAPGDAAALAAVAAAAAVVQQQLAAGTRVRLPAAGAVLPRRTIDVEGSVGVANVRTVRVALAAAGDAGAPFPRERARSVPVVGGTFVASLLADADGPVHVRVQAEHDGGVVAEAPVHAVVVDTLAPAVTFVAPDDDAAVGAQVDVVVRVVDTTALRVRIGERDAEPRGDGTFAATLVLADGVQALAAVADDAAGNRTTASRSVRVDAVPPALVLTGDVPAVTAARQLRLLGAAAGGATVRAGGATAAVGADGTFTLDVPLAPGVNDVTLVAADIVGNVSPARSVRVRCDVEPPVLAWREPGTDVVPAGDVTVRGTVADDSACDVTVDGAAAAVDGSTWSAIVRVDADRTTVVRVAARDAAGNAAAPIERSLHGEAPFVVLPWADPAGDATRVRVGGDVYPSVVVDKRVGVRMVLVPASAPGATMGSPPSEPERGDDETLHARTVAAFWLGETEVTQAQWRQVMGAVPSPANDPALPVVNVSWDECQQFVQRLGANGTPGYRLPSEAEWEHACRAETTTPFAFGATITTDQVAFDGSRPYAGAPRGENRRSPVAARSLPANAFGLHEMHGNVQEWCEDRYAPYPGTGTEAPARGDGPRVVRGGSFGSTAGGCRSAFRFGAFQPWTRNERLGLRLARSL